MDATQGNCYLFIKEVKYLRSVYLMMPIEDELFHPPKTSLFWNLTFVDEFDRDSVSLGLQI